MVSRRTTRSRAVHFRKTARRGSRRRSLAKIALVVVLALACAGVPVAYGVGGIFAPSADVTAQDASTQAATQGLSERVADTSTANAFGDLLGEASDGGRYTGRVWTDKSVYTDATVNLDGVNTVNDSDFLTVYSALGSTRVVNGSASTPLDVVLVLDVSTSMSVDRAANKGQGPIVSLTSSTNNLINQIMSLNPRNRVGVVVYSGGAQTLMPLAHYNRSGNTPYLTLNQQTGWELAGTPETPYNSYNQHNFNSFTARGVAVAADGSTSNFTRTSQYMRADSTYLQGALYEGMGMLTNATDISYEEGGQTVTHIPALVVLTDGGTNVMTKSTSATAQGNNWWNPITGVMGTYGNSGNAALWPQLDGNPLYLSLGQSNASLIAPRTLATLMTAGYMKKQVDAHYGIDMQGYGVGLNIGGLGDLEAEQLYATMNPKGYFVSGGNGYSHIGAAYNSFQSYLNRANPALTYSGSYLSTTVSGTYYVKHPTAGIADFSSVDELYYIDQFYNANTDNLNDIFDNIYSQLGGLAFHPVTSGGAGGAAGGVTYTDPIGDYMELKSLKALRLFGVDYPIRDNGNGTYTVTTAAGADAVIRNPEYVNETTFRLSDISIRLTKADNPDTSSGTGQPGIPDVQSQTLTVNLPEAALPLRKETIDLNAERDAAGHQTVRSYTSNASSVVPLRLFYTVGVSDAIKDANGTVDLSRVNRDYRKAHSAVDGNGHETVEFYSNVYEGTHGDAVNAGIGAATVGDATVAFSPDESNRYYYFQKNRVIYSSGAEGFIGEGGRVGSPVTGALNEDGTYYLVIDFYGPQAGTASGYGYRELVIQRSGHDLANAVAYIDAPASGYYTDTRVTEYPDPGSGRVMATEVGGVRLGRLNSFAREKAESADRTGTADYSFVPTYTNAGVDAESFMVYQGNNGRVRVADTAIQVTKLVNATRDANGNELGYGDEPLFNYTIRFTGLANRTIEADRYEYVENADHSHSWTAVTGADGAVQTQTLSVGADGSATFKLGNGEGLRLRDLAPGVAYTVTEETAVDGVDAGMSSTLGQPDADGYFYFQQLTGDGTVDAGTRTIAGTTANGVVQRADYVNQFTKTVTTARPLAIYKELDGREFDPADQFTFIMTPGGQSEGGVANTPMPQGSYTSADGSTYTRTIGPGIAGTEIPGSDPIAYRSDDPILFLDDASSGSMDPNTTITFTQPGTYTYLIREQRPTGGSSIAGITYENTVYRLRIAVDVRENELVASLASIERRNGDTADYEPYWSENDGDPSLTFRNNFNVNDVVRTFQGRKTLEGQTLRQGQFEFVLRALGSHPVVLDGTYDALKDDSTLTTEQKIAYIEDHVGVDIAGWNEHDVHQPMPGNGEAGYRFMPEVSARNGEGGLVTFGETHFSDTLELTSPTDTNLRGVIYKYQVRETQPTDTGLYDGTALPGGIEDGHSFAAAAKIDHDGDPSTPERWYYKGVVYDDSLKTFYVYAHLDPYTDPAGGTGTVIHASVLGDMPFNLDTGSNYANEYRANTVMPLSGVKAITGRPFQGADDAAGIVADSFTFHVAGERVSGDGATGATPMPDGIDAAGNVTIMPTQGTEAAVDFGKVTFTNADAGSTYRYTITETGTGSNGVTNDGEPRVIDVTVTDDDLGNVSYVVTDAEGAEVPTDPVSIWTNRYEAQSIGVNLTGTKTFVGHPLNAGAFSFDVTQVDADGVPIADGLSQRVTNQAGQETGADTGAYEGAVSFLSSTWTRFGEAGTYRFLIDEADEPLADGSAVEFDQSQYLVTIVVSDNHMGALGADITQVSRRTGAEGPWQPMTAGPDGGYDVGFENDYVGQTAAILALRKQFVGADTASMAPHSFIISANPHDDGAPADGVRLPANTEVQNDADGNISFDPVTFTEEGNYAIHVHEKQPTVDGSFEGEGLPGAHKASVDGGEHWCYQGVLYDNHTATSIFAVTRDPVTGGLDAQRTSTATTRVFTNNANLSIEKQLTGELDEGDAAEEFTFTVGAWTQPQVGEESNNAVTGDYHLEVYDAQSGTILEDGRRTITFAADGSKGVATFTLRGGQIARIVGLPTGCEYEIDEELSEEQREDWTLVNPEEGPVTGTLTTGSDAHHVFVNRKGEPIVVDATVHLDAVKVVTSPQDEEPYELGAGDFSFTLYPGADNPDTDPVDGPITVTNDAQGNVTVMDGVTYTAPGTYRYVLVEDSTDPMPDMIYDSSRYGVTVTVAKGDTGEYAAEVSLTKNGEDYEEAEPVFDNRYQPGVVSIDLTGRKVLEGRPLLDQEFRFMLSPVSAMVAQVEEAVASVMGIGDGNAARPSADEDDETVPAPDDASEPSVVTDGAEPDADVPDGDEAREDDALATLSAQAIEDDEDADTAADGDDEAASAEGTTTTPARADKAEVAAGQGDDGAGATDAGRARRAFSKDLVELAASEMPMPTDATMDEGLPVAITTNLSADRFGFGAMAFDRPGVYTYRITEVDDGAQGINYDGTAYIVEVTVAQPDESEDTLVASARIVEPEDADEVVFTNVYTPEPDEPTPTPTPDNPGTPTTPEKPQPTIVDYLLASTGDPTRLGPLFAVGGIALVALAVIACVRRRMRFREEGPHRRRLR